MTDDKSANDVRATVLRAAIDEGIAELDAGCGEEMSVEELMAEVRRELDLVTGVTPTS
jgi:hypothetical protein